MQQRIGMAAFLVSLAIGAAAAYSQEQGYVLTIRDHKFEPSNLEIPAGTEVTIVVKNADSTPEEFESEALDLEKVIPGGAEAEFTVGPLEPGTYEFVGEFNMDTAVGSIIVQ